MVIRSGVNDATVFLIFEGVRTKSKSAPVLKAPRADKTGAPI